MSIVKVSRNEPCPCGSGKKYKKCCGSKDTVLITDVIDHEVLELQKEARIFAMQRYGYAISDDFEDLLQVLEDAGEEDEDFYEFLHPFWFLVFEPLEDGKTIMKNFIEQKLLKVSRTRVKAILKSWQKGYAVAGVVKESHEKSLIIEDTLTGKQYPVVLFEHSQNYKEGVFAFAILHPYEDKYTVFPTLFELSIEHTADYEAFIRSEFLSSGYSSPEGFLEENFLEMMHETPKAGATLDLSGFEWPSNGAKTVADLFEKDMKAAGELTWIIQMGVTFWIEYCKQTNKKIQKPENYVAALRYLVSTLAPVKVELTQKQAGELYGLAANRVSSYYSDIYFVVEDKISAMLEHEQFQQGHVLEAELHEALKEIEENQFENMEEINDFLQARINDPKPKTKTIRHSKDEAQELIYAALESVGKDRYRLAQKALALNPFHADGYTILAEQADSLQSAAKLFEKGMLAGREELGEEFFNENKGYFWGLIETRPFMRAAMNYALAIQGLGELKAAISQYEELLELNPADNQGIRYMLFIAYCEDKQIRKASELLKRFPEDNAQGTYNKALIEILSNGLTAKADQLIHQAKKANKHVVDFLTGKKKLPADSPDYYGHGDKNEAVVYVSEHQHLWNQMPNLKEWLSK
ncbi:SEC-C metal-binding domain-containing protein [Cytobacillus praedii]|uniref:SEC-C metal-binding domain-containing protein n=1 Tax=Cytobacillus praedii TaxID=1742358 RepID=UPI0013F452CF|nr:SEC-C metal-binding domain-containing protein [Cytobacillus praedii]